MLRTYSYPLLDIKFAALGEFIHEWAKQYDGKQPRDWLRLHRSLWDKYRNELYTEELRNEWVQAWAKEYCAREHKPFYFILNITQAHQDQYRVEGLAFEEPVCAAFKLFDQLPCAKEVWQAEINSLIDLTSVPHELTSLFDALFAPCQPQYSNPEHPIWAASIAALENQHQIFLHITHPNEDMAAATVNEGWRIFEKKFDSAVVAAMLACGSYPWEAWNIMQMDTAAPPSMDGIEF